MESRIDTGQQDATDYMAMWLMRNFPDLDVKQETMKPHRQGLVLTLPSQTEYDTSVVDDAAFSVMQYLYFMSDCKYLVAYTIQRERFEEEENSAD
jgi:hypothetical protein